MSKGDKRPLEQREMETLLQTLNARTTEEATKSAQEMVQAIAADPLVLTISINRATGRFTLASNVAADQAVDDLRMLHDATLALNQHLGRQMLQAATGGQRSGE